MNNHGYKFYMQEIDINGNLKGERKDLEVDFNGEKEYLADESNENNPVPNSYKCLLYSKMVGLNDIGKPRIYTESYAEENGIRAYVPDVITNDSTNISLTLFFVGRYRNNVMFEFNEYIRKGRHRYWDTARNKKFDFIVTSNIKVSSEHWDGSTPYLEVTYVLQNLGGKTENIIIKK